MSINKKIGVLISGSGSNLGSLIDKVHKKSGVIDIVISDKEDAYGLIRAKNAGIDTLVIDSKNFGSREAFSNKLKEELKKRNIDLVVLAGFMKILSGEFINDFQNKIINIHPSLIPSFCGKGYYGLKVHEGVIEYGAKVSGATVHFVDEGADTGPIILQEALYVNEDDDATSLQKRILLIEHNLLPKAVELFCNNKIKVINRKVSIKE